MLKLRRVCVPLSLDCDLRCKYCYREAGRRTIPAFSKSMIEYLQQLTPDVCDAVVASGGEPLLHVDRVKELFSYVPKNVHKKLMTNGLNLTSDLIDYINENSIEVQTSHDGEKTEFLRGIDILKEQDLLDLILKIDDLRIFSVCTTYNPNPYENYLNTISYLNGKEIEYATQAVFEDVHVPDMIKDFDYLAYSRGFFKLTSLGVFQKTERTAKHAYGAVKRNGGFNVLPDGTVVGMSNINQTYGTIYNTREELMAKKRQVGLDDFCLNSNCRIRDICNLDTTLASPHTCECCKITNDCFLYFSNEEELESGFCFRS